MSDTESESDIDNKLVSPKMIVKKKLPQSPPDDVINNNKKIPIKMMITYALKALKTRKGVSLYAIKKYLTEEYNVNTEKGKNLIKKSLRAGVEDGTFIQMKGIGASGSFKLANMEKPKRKKKESKQTENKELIEKANTEPKKTSKEPKKPKKIDTKKKDSGDEEPAKRIEKSYDKKPTKKKLVAETVEKKSKDKNKNKLRDSDNNMSENEDGKIKKNKVKNVEKRTAMKKRKSIGSIIKPPKMKPKSRS